MIGGKHGVMMVFKRKSEKVMVKREKKTQTLPNIKLNGMISKKAP